MKALLTGITGQDGSYLAELLLSRGYEVHGLVRRASTLTTERIDHLYVDPHEPTRLHLHFGDLTDASGLRAIVERIQPDEVYNLGAQSHVRVSFDQAEYTADVVATGTLRLLEACRPLPRVRFYEAASSEMFGSSPPPQSEMTPFRPRSPYAAAKVAAFQYARVYREAYGMHVSCGILHNHESERRGETFVTRKITRAATRIKLGLQDKLYLGNLDAVRDWGHAADYVDAMWLMLQQDAPDDYVIATGESHTVREFVESAFSLLDLDPARHLAHDPRYLRPAEVESLRGDASKARRVLGWEPTVSFAQLVERMVASDLELAKREATLRAAGHRVERRLEP